MLLSKKPAFLGLCTALCVIFLAFASYLKTNTIFFTLFSTALVMLGAYEYKSGGGLLVYFCSAVLAIFVLPDKKVSLYFTLFFGYYPILKGLIEKKSARSLQWILKISVGTVGFFAVWFFFSTFFFSEVPFPFMFMYFLSLAVFVVYDIVLSVFLKFYLKRIKPNIK